MRAPATVRLVALAVLSACVPRRGGAAERCSYNSDCADGLVCASGACRVACREDRDCAGGLRCAGTGTAGHRTCVSPGSPAMCGIHSDCPAGSVCAPDGRCRVRCATDGDCSPDGGSARCDGNGFCSASVVVPELDAGGPLTCGDGPCCPTGRTLCADRCVDVTSDPSHCGRCNVQCPTGAPCRNTACAPPNDHCEQATPIPMTSSSTTVSVVTAGASDDPGSCNGHQDVFFSFELLRREIVWAYTGAAIGVARMPCGSRPVGCADSGCGTGTTDGQIVEVLDPGRYVIAADSWNGRDYGLTLHFEHIPVLDAPVARIDASRTTLVGDTTGASNTPGTCGDGPDRYYVWTTCPADRGGAFVASTCAGDGGAGAPFDTVLQVLHGAGLRSDCNDDACGMQSSVTSMVSSGVGLHVLIVDGAAGAAGPFTVALRWPM